MSRTFCKDKRNRKTTTKKGKQTNLLQKKKIRFSVTMEADSKYQEAGQKKTKLTYHAGHMRINSIPGFFSLSLKTGQAKRYWEHWTPP